MIAASRRHGQKVRELDMPEPASLDASLDRAFAPPAPADRRAAAIERRRLALDDRKRSFLRMVSHELRTPLNAVIGFSEIIARELHGPIDDPRYVEHARMIRESGLDLLRLVNRVVDIARLESGAMELDLRPEPLDEMVTESFAAVRESAEAKGVRLAQLLAWDASPVRADRRGFGMVMNALLTNAVTASPEGGTVSVTAQRRGDRVFVTVRDDGPGIDPAEVPRLMRPFEQGENALVRRTAGAGLGLPFARLLCAAMGGRLQLRTAPGKGLAAVIRLDAA
jgi:signal transduction histidine kinase